MGDERTLGDKVEENLGALLRREGVFEGAVGAVLTAGEALDGSLPGMSGVIKSLVVSDWAWNPKKAERVVDVLGGLAERIHRNKKEFVGKEELLEVLQDVLRRLGDEPRSERHRTFRDILERVLEKGQVPAEHVAFVRLAAELPTTALKILAVIGGPVVTTFRAEPSLKAHLAKAAQIPVEEVGAQMEYLSNLGLLDRESFTTVVGAAPTLELVLTHMGREFVSFISGVA